MNCTFPAKPNIGFFANVAFIVLFVSLASCVSNKRVPYFRDIPDTTAGMRVKEHTFFEPKIQPDDILSISIQTIDPQTSTILNQISPPISVGPANNLGTSDKQVVTGFLVGSDGVVELPIIGKIKIGGLTTFEARDVIREKVAVYFKNPAVLVRFANYKITIIGEVARPGTYTMPNEKVSLLDAIGAAGDLTIYGKRDNILLIRETAGGKEFVRFNLNSSELFKSPYFYLKQNDVVYIEPSKAKIASLNVARAQLIALAGTVLTLVIVIVTRVNF